MAMQAAVNDDVALFALFPGVMANTFQHADVENLYKVAD